MTNIYADLYFLKILIFVRFLARHLSSDNINTINLSMLRISYDNVIFKFDMLNYLNNLFDFLFISQEYHQELSLNIWEFFRIDRHGGMIINRRQSLLLIIARPKWFNGILVILISAWNFYFQLCFQNGRYLQFSSHTSNYSNKKLNSLLNAETKHIL